MDVKFSMFDVFKSSPSLLMIIESSFVEKYFFAEIQHLLKFSCQDNHECLRPSSFGASIA
jgi:hypothetical protein